MSSDAEQFQRAIAAIEAQRTILGDAVAEIALAPLRARLAALTAGAGNAPPGQSLKQVTIVFMDAVGFTRLSQRLDPEAIGTVMDDALRRATDIVERHQGKVLQYAGDNILAVFGADQAREDAAERAVRCGLALRELGQTLGREVQDAHGHRGFDVRVGVHTGDVLLGGGVEADGSIRGLAVNIAARMEQTAPPGALRISQDTYAQVRGMFEVEPQPPLTVSGIDDPVQSYLVIRAKPRTFHIGTRGIEGVATRMIGRDVELEALQQGLRRLLDERRLSTITVVADAGIGKSRLLYEFESWSETQPETFLVFRGRATPQTQGQPFGLLRDILAWRFQIADDDGVEIARAKMEQGIAPLFEDDDGADAAVGHAHVLGHLIGIEWRDSRHLRGILDDPRQIRNRAFHVAAQLFRRASARRGHPVVLELEDLHWADGESLDFLAYLTEVGRDVPMLIVAFCRPALFERRPQWCGERAHRRIDLAPLGRDMSRLLAHELLKKLPEVPAALRELVIGGSEGNPFYMEELVKMLIDQGAIETGETWRVNAHRLLVTQVPATLTGVLQARLDSLPAPERLTLQEASIIGPVFWDRALLALNATAKETLPALVRRELALPRVESSTDELREYAFKHQILHQVTYATVLKRTQRELHGKLARWLASQTGLRANDFVGTAARHFELAGDFGNAAEFHVRAAEQARSRLAHEALLDHAQRAFELLDQLDETTARLLRWRLLQTRETTLDMRGERAAQRADIAAMTTLADALDDDRRRAHAAWRLSAWAHRTADYPLMETAARSALASASRAGDAETRLISKRMQAMALAFQGRAGEGQVVAEEALGEARALALHWVEGSCLNALGVIAAMRDDDVGALMHDQQSLRAYQAAGDRRNEAIARGNIGAGWLSLGDLGRARSELEEGLRLLRANGDRALEVSPLCALSTLALWQGDDALALVHARTALDIAVEVQARDQQAAALCRLGDAELALGRHEAAAQACREALQSAVEIDHPYRHDAAAGLARVALSEGAVGSALQALEPVLALATRADAAAPALEGCEFPRWIEYTCYRALAHAGDPRASRWLDIAHQALTTQAARIADTGIRDGFLNHIPQHRDIVSAWERHREATAN